MDLDEQIRSAIHLMFEMLRKLGKIAKWEGPHLYCRQSAVSLAALLIAGPLTAQAKVYHRSDWEASGSTPGECEKSAFTGIGRWQEIQAAACYSLQRVTSPARGGNYALRVEIRPGDVVHSGERAEVAHMNYDGTTTEVKEDAHSPAKHLAFSVQIPTDWKPPEPNSAGYVWGIIWQLFSGSGSPPIAFSAQDRFIFQNEASTRGNYELSKSGLEQGEWVDFVVRIEFAATNTGAIDIWRRDAGETTFRHVLALRNIATLDHTGAHYWKHGLYRSPSDHGNILYLDSFVLADTFEEAVQAAFGD
jgi:hypothetical protein